MIRLTCKRALISIWCMLAMIPMMLAQKQMDSSVIDVTLQDEDALLDEVVVVGYGVKRQTSDIQVNFHNDFNRNIPQLAGGMFRYTIEDA